jgi:hypothetical protein
VQIQAQCGANVVPLQIYEGSRRRIRIGTPTLSVYRTNADSSSYSRTIHTSAAQGWTRSCIFLGTEGSPLSGSTWHSTELYQARCLSLCGIPCATSDWPTIANLPTSSTRANQQLECVRLGLHLGTFYPQGGVFPHKPPSALCTLLQSACS